MLEIAKSFLYITLSMVLLSTVFESFGKDHYDVVQRGNTPHIGDKKFDAVPLYDPIVRIHDYQGHFMCTGWVFDASFIGTAGHCVLKDGKLIDKPYKIVSQGGAYSVSGIAIGG